MTPIEIILDAFRSERQYQVRRWGIRQPDGTFQEVGHPLAEWLVYINHWLNRIGTELTGQIGVKLAMDSLRKVICLAWAAMEQDGYNIDAIFAALNVRRENQPPTPRSIAGYILAITVALNDAIRAATEWDRQGEVKAILLDIINIGVACFQEHGITEREEEEIINARDGEPA